MKKFIDQTGLPGPDLWEDGRHPEGKGDHPVRGVSWYEAAAYAKFVKKQLPTHIHWWRASAGRDEHLRPLSNLNGAGPHPIGQDEGIGVFGVYDMGGNVKEWCRTKYGENDRSICGGHWRGPSYLAREISHAPPMSREDSYGFRCARYFVKGNEWAVEPRIVKPVVFDPPATAEEVAQNLRFFEYDKEVLLKDTLVNDDRDPDDPDLRHEIVRIDAAYGDERFDVHLLIPRRARGPLQTILWFPGVASLKKQTQEERRQSKEFEFERALARTGRIVCSPVYKGTYERFQGSRKLKGVRKREWRVQMAKDLFRTIDYLETRSDVDSKTLVYAGLSMGSVFGPNNLVAEPRLKFALLFAVGSGNRKGGVELSPMRYASHVKVPVLLLNGRFDRLFLYDEQQVPFFERLGSADKHLEVFPAGHLPPVTDAVDFADKWLSDRTQRGE